MKNEILHILNIKGYKHLQNILFKIIEEEPHYVKVEVFSNEEFIIEEQYLMEETIEVVPKTIIHYIPSSHFPKNCLVGSIYTFDRKMFYEKKKYVFYLKEALEIEETI